MTDSEIPYTPSWLRSLLLGLSQIFAWGGSFFLMAVLIGPVTKETGWPSSWVYGSLSLSIFISGLLAPSVGRQIARQRGKAILMHSGWVIGAGLVVVGLAPVLPLFILGWCLIGVGMSMGLYDALFATLGQQHGLEAKKIIPHITLISGFATTITWPSLAWLIEQFGWRHTCTGYAVFLSTILPILYHWGCRGQTIPQTIQTQHHASSSGLSTENQLMFRWVVINFMIAAVLMTAISVQLLSILQAKGLTLKAAIQLGALIGPCQVGVRLLDLMGPKKHPIWSALISSILVLVGLLLLGLDVSLATIGVVLYSLGNGIRSILRGTLPLELFGPESFAVVLGRLARPALIAQALTPLLGGYLVQHGGPLTLLAVLAALAFLNIGVTVAIKQQMTPRLSH
ncbi:hypothetical protein [Siphonobacter sp. SORGH_AS_0500]|uniref:hypothetical protein n=1 Tax=Siphonobacter sp. SORGH_AS_0500 TaxID=1864824 RepID=UPI0028674C8F|nr:hypothetical protein [Siphonobacter sp. SORGH_AS_0500]MDR6193836.1 MFS family permease [Siphonobacter sp. SORGH_AS_0500]